MPKRLLRCAALVSVLGPVTVVEASDLATPIPITDPRVEPQVSGFGVEPNVQAAFGAPTVLFVNFDGGMMRSGCGNDSKNDCSTIINGEIAPFPGSDVERASVMQAVRADVTDFGVIAVGERPPPSQDYAMVMAGKPVGYDVGNIGGVAPGINCGNTNPNITSFSFLTGGSNVVATVIHQEAAHTWGLEHVDDRFDNLYPMTGGANDPKYQDRCSKIVADTDLNPTAGQCNAVHTMFCDHGYQNSYREMLLLFGPPLPDVTPPTVVIEAPFEGEVLDYEEDFELVITLDDDRRPQILRTTISIDGAEQPSITLIDKTHTLKVRGGDPPDGHGWSDGPHTIRVDIEDEHGNPAFDEVTLLIENAPVAVGDDGSSGEGGGTLDDDDTDGPGDGGDGGDGGALGGDESGDGGCSCATPSRPQAAALFLLLLIGLRPGRRLRA